MTSAEKARQPSKQVAVEQISSLYKEPCLGRFFCGLLWRWSANSLAAALTFPLCAIFCHARRSIETPLLGGAAVARRSRHARTLQTNATTTSSPALKIFFAEAPSAERLPPFWGRNRFWTGFLGKRGMIEISPRKSPPTRGPAPAPANNSALAFLLRRVSPRQRRPHSSTYASTAITWHLSRDGAPPAD